MFNSFVHSLRPPSSPCPSSATAVGTKQQRKLASALLASCFTCSCTSPPPRPPRLLFSSVRSAPFSVHWCVAPFALADSAAGSAAALNWAATVLNSLNPFSAWLQQAASPSLVFSRPSSFPPLTSSTSSFFLCVFVLFVAFASAALSERTRAPDLERGDKRSGG